MRQSLPNELLRLQIAFHSPFYAPVYLARRLGLFAAEGLDATIASPEPGKTIDAIASGEADIAVSGVMRAHVAAGLAAPRRLVAIAEINSRDGFVLVSRKPPGAFRWADLGGMRLILFAEAPTPWMCLQHVLRREGVDRDEIALIRGLPAEQAIEALRTDRGDYLQTTLPAAEELIDAGQAHLATTMAAAVGHVPFSSLLVTPQFRDQRPDLCQRAVSALARAQRWMATEHPERAADLIAPDFPNINPRFLRKIVARYCEAGTWPVHPAHERAPFERLGRMLVDGGLVRRAASFEAIVDNTFAEAAAADLA